MPLLLGTSHRRHNRPTNKKDDEQDRCSKVPHPMGHKVWLVRHRISALVAIKAQDLADFIVEFTYPLEKEEPQKKT